MAPGAFLLVLGLTAAVVGCSSDGDRAAGCATVRAAEDTGALTGTLDLADLGVTTAAEDRPGLSTVTVVSRRSIDDLLPLLRTRLDRAGYERLGEDDEGFEAEIYLARGADTYGLVRLREDQECDGRTNLQVAVSTKAADSNTPSPAST